MQIRMQRTEKSKQSLKALNKAHEERIEDNKAIII